MMEILRIQVRLTGSSQVQGGQQRVVMLPFEGECQSPLFRGAVLPGGVDTQRIEKDGRCFLSARYMLRGTDAEGQPCSLFIENQGFSDPGKPWLTRPVIRTDSAALRWLETAELSGRIEPADDHIEIVISGERSPRCQPLLIRRGGLSLRGRLEKKTDQPCPLVLMLHGFGGDMGVNGWFQTLSDRLTDAGMATLRFDFNGHGQSEGSFSDMTPYNEIEDAAAFLHYALESGEYNRIMLLGHSQGGVVAGMLAGYYHDLIDRLVLLAPAAVLKTDAQKGRCMRAKYDPQRIPRVVRVDDKHAVGGLFFRMAQSLPIYEVTGQFGGRAMIVLPGQDTVVSRESVRAYRNCLRQCCYVEKATLDHGLAGEEREQLLDEIVGFLG